MKVFAPAVLLALGAATPAFAATTIDFDAVTSFASIADFYDGGTDSAGAAGPALGLRFGGDALVVANDAAFTYYAGAPSPTAVMTAVGGNSALNAVAGLSNGISFYYSATATVLNGVQVWSGLDGTGSVIASFNLTANNPAAGCNGGDTSFCRFDLLAGSFSGVAHSVTFDSSGVTAFDNVTVTVTPVPEPTTFAMMAIGLAGLAFAARRRG